MSGYRKGSKPLHWPRCVTEPHPESSPAVKWCEGGGCPSSRIAPWGLPLRFWESRNGAYSVGWLLVFCRDPLCVLCQLPVG